VGEVEFKKISSFYKLLIGAGVNNMFAYLHSPLVHVTESRDGGVTLRGRGGLIHYLNVESDTVRHKFALPVA
jgi:hypothetical protein